MGQRISRKMSWLIIFKVWGVKFGAHLNAYTSFDETVYILPIPSDDDEIVEQGLTILEDWSSGLLFEQEELDKERGVVIEEWRLGQGAQMRMLNEFLPRVTQRFLSMQKRFAYRD